MAAITQMRVRRWRWRESDEDAQPWLLWVALPLIGYLVWRLRAERVSARTPDAGPPPPPRSALTRLVEDLEAQLSARAPGETLPHWLRGVQQDPSTFLAVKFGMQLQREDTAAPPEIPP